MNELAQVMSAVGMFGSAILFAVCFKMYLADRKQRGRKNLKEERLKRRKIKAKEMYGGKSIFTKIKGLFKK